MNLNRIHSISTLLLLFFLTSAFLTSISLRNANAQTPQELANQFSPVLRFTSGEKFYPTSTDYIITSSTLKQRATDGTSTTVTDNPTPSNLGSYAGTDLFLDNKLETFENIAEDYAEKADTIGYYAYVRIVTSGSTKTIQYWLFYVFNNGPLNDHQGDLEVIQIFLDGSNNPQQALYSQHGAGENAAWGDVEKQDTHPIVYVAQGSHANFFRPYQGKMGIESDIVSNDGKTITPTDLNLIMLGEQGSHPPEQSWLDFAGRWGYWGTDEDAAVGRAGPLGPIFNQDGIRWASPQSYLDTTMNVNGTYFILAWLIYNFLLLFVIYVAVRAAWKIVSIVRLHRKGGLLVMKFLKGRGGIGLGLGIVALLIMVTALFFPWYTITASSQAGPLANQGDVTLMNIDGINGIQVNLFFGPGGDATSGYSSLFSLQIPFAILIAVGLILLALDVIGVKNPKSLGLKFMLGAITSLIPIILIFIFINQLPIFLPWASQLAPGRTIPPQLETTVRAIAGNPVTGTTSQQFPTVGTTTVNWGFGVGAYMFIAAAVIRIIAGYVMRSSSKLQEKPAPTPTQPQAPTTEPPEKPKSTTPETETSPKP
jgi:hypothetical protein